MTWKYEQSTGNLYTPEGERLATGYAGGNCGNSPEGVNNPAMQDIHNVGPLPCGMYTFGTPENNPKLGPFAIPLIPFSGNEMFGRAGFFMHGDTSAMNHSASEGCIIMGATTRHTCAASDDKLLQVVAVKE